MLGAHRSRCKLQESFGLVVLVILGAVVAGNPVAVVTAVAGDTKAGELDECADAPPEWIFCSCFEEGNLDIWDDYDGNPAETNQLVTDPGPLDQASNHVMRLWIPPGRGTAPPAAGCAGLCH